MKCDDISILPISGSISRVKTVQEHLRVVKEHASFEIAALFQPSYSWVKKQKFKSCIFVDKPESFFWCLYSKIVCKFIIGLWKWFQSKSSFNQTVHCFFTIKYVFVSATIVIAFKRTLSKSSSLSIISKVHLIARCNCT